MAAKGKPELDNGYLRIANELWQALIDYDLTGAQMKLIAVIIRETYGYNRKSKDLSLSYLAKAAHLSKIGARKALNKLIAHNVVKEYGECSPRKSRKIGINKYYNEWLRVIPQDTSEGNQRRPLLQDTSEGNQSITLEVSQRITKPIQYKDTIKDNTPSASETGYTAQEEERFGGW